MSYTVSFMDNEPVTAEFLNSAAAELGGGVLAFEDGGNYGIEHLNDISGALITKGVSRGCGLGAHDGQVTIGAGVLYLSDGRRITIGDAGVTMDFVSGQKNYVWFGFDSVSGFVSPRCTTTEPMADDVVVVGYITEAGEAVSKPDRAVMKHPFLALHSTESYEKKFSWDFDLEEKLLWEIDITDVGYHYLLIHSEGYLQSDKAANAFCGFLDLTTQSAFSVLDYYMYADDGQEAKVYSSDSGEMIVSCTAYTPTQPSSQSPYYFIYLRFELGTDNVLRVYQRVEKSGNVGYVKAKEVNLVLTFC